MKNTGAAVLIVGVLLASPTTSVLATPERIHEQKLLIAIDDGTEDGQLFVEMDNSATAVLQGDLPPGEPRPPIDTLRRVPVERMSKPGDVMIVSNRTIDNETRDCIRSILSSSGHGGEVVFVDHQEASAPPGGSHSTKNELHRVKSISKEISATN